MIQHRMQPMNGTLVFQCVKCDVHIKLVNLLLNGHFECGYSYYCNKLLLFSCDISDGDYDMERLLK